MANSFQPLNELPMLPIQKSDDPAVLKIANFRPWYRLIATIVPIVAGIASVFQLTSVPAIKIELDVIAANNAAMVNVEPSSPKSDGFVYTVFGPVTLFD